MAHYHGEEKAIGMQDLTPNACSQLLVAQLSIHRLEQVIIVILSVSLDFVPQFLAH